IISIETPGSHAFPNVSAWPMMRLPTSEPLRLPRPPTTTTISAGIRIVTPTEGYADWIGPGVTPESPPSAAPKAKTPVNMRSVLIPRPAAISASKTPARMIAPRRVFSIRSQSASAMTSPKAITKSRYEGSVASPSVTEPAKRAGGGVGPHPPAPDPLDEVLEEVDQPEREQHLVERRPAVERPQEPPLDERADQPDGQRRQEQRHPEAAGRRDQREARVHAEHVEGAVREVDDVEHAEDQREPDGEQEQQHAVGEAVQRLTEEVGDEGHGREASGGGARRPAPFRPVRQAGKVQPVPGSRTSATLSIGTLVRPNSGTSRTSRT